MIFGFAGSRLPLCRTRRPMDYAMARMVSVRSARTCGVRTYFVDDLVGSGTYLVATSWAVDVGLIIENARRDDAAGRVGHGRRQVVGRVRGLVRRHRGWHECRMLLDWEYRLMGASSSVTNSLFPCSRTATRTRSGHRDRANSDEQAGGRVMMRQTKHFTAPASGDAHGTRCLQRGSEGYDHGG